MTEKDFFNIVYIDDTYTNFLYDLADNRVSFNNNQNYQRPYIGVIFAMNSQCYFAPMTSSNKGNKLYLHPKQEDITFLPINNCQNGGINFNNMIPVNEKVFHKADLILKPSDPQWVYEKKLNLINAQRFIRRNLEKIVAKAISLYDMKTMGRLDYSKNKITCNFKRLDIAYGYYGAFMNDEFSTAEIADRISKMIPYEKPYNSAVKTSLRDPLQEKYKLTAEQFAGMKRHFEKECQGNKDATLEAVIRNNIAHAPVGQFDADIQKNLQKDFDRGHAKKKPGQSKTQEKNAAKSAPKDSSAAKKKPYNGK